MVRGQGWSQGESAEPMAPAFGLLREQVPIAVLKQLVPTSTTSSSPMAQFCSWLPHFGQDMSLLRGHFPTAVGDAANGDPD